MFSMFLVCLVFKYCRLHPFCKYLPSGLLSDSKHNKEYYFKIIVWYETNIVVESLMAFIKSALMALEFKLIAQYRLCLKAILAGTKFMNKYNLFAVMIFSSRAFDRLHLGLNT